MACRTFEDSLQDLQGAHREMLELEVIFSSLQRTAKSMSLDLHLKKKLLFLMSISDDEQTSCLGKDDSEFNLLGLPQDMMAQLTSVDFTPSELQLIKELFVKEVPKVTKEISDNVSMFDSTITSGLDICKIVEDLQSLGLDLTTEIENIVKYQNEFIDLKYKDILGTQIKKAEQAEEDLKKISQAACDLYETTLNAVYPSEECYGKMEEEARMLEKEHEEMNEKLAEVHSLKEQYNQLDQQPEFKILVNQNRELNREIKLKEMVLEEMRKLNLSESTSCNDFVNKLQ
ncbi:uncharacterized protein isoform X1 [Rhodnius prolixus]|uniref:Uncharacterized protein n=1 Tax=Rhodnius prolixus TaxID=13249 RepID=T1HI01_RHOPR